jgi:hypothetical protein
MARIVELYKTHFFCQHGDKKLNYFELTSFLNSTLKSNVNRMSDSV